MKIFLKVVLKKKKKKIKNVWNEKIVKFINNFFKKNKDKVCPTTSHKSDKAKLNGVHETRVKRTQVWIERGMKNVNNIEHMETVHLRYWMLWTRWEHT